METSVLSKLRSAKHISENNRQVPVKDASKRAADPLPEGGGKKRILGDITNKTIHTNKNAGQVNNRKSKNASHSSILGDVEKIKIKESPAVDRSSKLSDSAESTIVIDGSEYNEESLQDIDDENFPPDVEDFDKNCLSDPFSVPHYAAYIFNYYKEREKKFAITKYISKQSQINRQMRAILVDWMVEVQESFELNHETLYLSVKLVDYYLMHHSVVKTKLQLIGATALFVAAKYDERIPPLVDDFLYICDDSYNREDMLKTEIHILRTVDFDLGFPLSYRFLRRYSRCGRIPMDMLTLARFILETSLMNYDVIDILDSKIAAAALLLALKMKQQKWTPALQYYTGYSEIELKEIIAVLNKTISTPPSKLLQTIRTKYSHSIFYEVAKILPLTASDFD